jgi:L-fucose isomerase-like protein
MTKIAFAGFGEVNTPIEVIERKCRAAYESLCTKDTEVYPFFPIRDDYEETYIKNAIEYFSDKEFDCLVLCVAGWIPSHAVVKVLDKFRHKPMVLWGLCGWYEDGHLVTTADQAGTSALRGALQNFGIKFKYVYDIVGKPSRCDRVLAYCKAASALDAMRTVRIGQLGYRDMQLYGTQFDGLSLKKTLGVEIECFEMLEVVQRAEKIDSALVNEVLTKRVAKWNFLKTPSEEAKLLAVKYYLAIKEICNERGYDAVSLKDVDGFKKLLGFPPAPILTLLAEDGLCTIPENDCLGNVTQVMVKKLTGQIGAYLEFYEYFEDGVLAGVPDYVPSEVAANGTDIYPAAFGELSQSLLNVSKVKEGVITMCRLATVNGKYYLHMVLGDGKTPETWEECGWDKPAPQLTGLKVLLENTEDFAEKVMGQHYIISYGDNRALISEFCRMVGIEII